MKKIIFGTLMLLNAFSGFGQNDKEAKKILESVAKKYNNYKTIQSDFKLAVETSNGQKHSDSGLMYFNKPKNQYAIILNDQEIISNGKDTWNISKDIKEVQISESTNSNESIGPNNLFTFYKTGYKYLLMNDEYYNKNGNKETLKVIELSPIDQKTNYYKIKIRINQNNHIHDVTIYDKTNNKYSYTIESLYIGKNLNNNLFTFNKDQHKGYEIIDLR